MESQELKVSKKDRVFHSLLVHRVLDLQSPENTLFIDPLLHLNSMILIQDNPSPPFFRLWLIAVSPLPGTISASSRTATPAMPSPPWRTDTPCAGRTSLGSSCASAGRSSSANHITQTWVSPASLLKPPLHPACPACSTHEVCLCMWRTVSNKKGRGKKSHGIKREGKKGLEWCFSLKETLATVPAILNVSVRRLWWWGQREFRGQSVDMPKIELHFLPIDGPEGKTSRDSSVPDEHHVFLLCQNETSKFRAQRAANGFLHVGAMEVALTWGKERLGPRKRCSSTPEWGSIRKSGICLKAGSYSRSHSVIDSSEEYARSLYIDHKHKPETEILPCIPLGVDK